MRSEETDAAPKLLYRKNTFHCIPQTRKMCLYNRYRGYKDGHKYAHDYPGHFADLEFMPEELKGQKFYEPADNKHEDALRSRLESLWPKYYK